MKKTWITESIIIAISLIVSSYLLSTTFIAGKKYDRYIQVKGLSEREVNADLAVWPMNIVIAGNDLGTLKLNIEAQKTEVYNFFAENGFKNEEISMGITNINDSKADMYNSGAPVSFRYQVRSEITIRTNDIEKLQKALNESPDLLAKGILLASKNPWRPIEYIFTRLNEIKPSMIEESTINAREAAEKFALDSNTKVGGIRVARQGLFSVQDRDQNTPEIKIVRVVSTIDFQLD